MFAQVFEARLRFEELQFIFSSLLAVGFPFLFREYTVKPTISTMLYCLGFL